MAKFRFRLQAVLRHRLQIEEERQRALATVQQQLTTLTNELKAMDDQVEQANQDLRTNHLVGPVNVGYLTAHRRFIVGVRRQAMMLVQRMALVQKQVDDARLALAEAAKQRKIIEKLREKQLDRWRQEAARKEGDALDEIGMQISAASILSELNAVTEDDL
jgi:flagellar FliJ protein